MKVKSSLLFTLLICLAITCLMTACASDDDDDENDDDDDDNDDNDDNNDDDDDDDDDDNDDDNDDDDDDDDDTIDFEYSIKTWNHGAVLPYLPNFASRGLRLYLGATPSSIGSQNLTDILTQAESLGVPITLCTYPSAGGFANEENIDIFTDDVNDFLDWLDTLTHAVDTIAINMELGHPIDTEMQDAWANRDIQLLIDLFRNTLDRTMFPVSVSKYQSLVQEIKNRGFEVQITTFPFLIDDMNDGDTDIQDICNSPLDGIDWDRIAPCAYSTEYSHMAGTFSDWPYFVYSYAKTAKELYGDAAVVHIGLVRYEGTPAYFTPDDLAADVAAAKAAGVKRIEVFKFSGMLAYPNYDFDDWADAFLAEPEIPPRDTAVDLTRMLLPVADFVLNFMQ